MSKPKESYEVLSDEMTENLQALVKMSACWESREYAATKRTWEEVWNDCPNPYWLSWYNQKATYGTYSNKFERWQAQSEFEFTESSVPYDAPCSCGCGELDSHSPESEAKLAAIYRERFPIIPTEPRFLVKLPLFKRFYFEAEP